MQEERDGHAHALRELRGTVGMDSLHAVLRAYAPWNGVMYERMRGTVMYVDAGHTPIALARFVIEYQIVVQVRRCDAKLYGIGYIVSDQEDISLVV